MSRSRRDLDFGERVGLLFGVRKDFGERDRNRDPDRASRFSAAVRLAGDGRLGLDFLAFRLSWGVRLRPRLRLRLRGCCLDLSDGDRRGVVGHFCDADLFASEARLPVPSPSPPLLLPKSQPLVAFDCADDPVSRLAQLSREPKGTWQLAAPAGAGTASLSVSVPSSGHGGRTHRSPSSTAFPDESTSAKALALTPLASPLTACRLPLLEPFLLLRRLRDPLLARRLADSRRSSFTSSSLSCSTFSSKLVGAPTSPIAAASRGSGSSRLASSLSGSGSPGRCRVCSSRGKSGGVSDLDLGLDVVLMSDPGGGEVACGSETGSGDSGGARAGVGASTSAIAPAAAGSANSMSVAAVARRLRAASCPPDFEPGTLSVGCCCCPLVPPVAVWGLFLPFFLRVIAEERAHTRRLPLQTGAKAFFVMRERSLIFMLLSN